MLCGPSGVGKSRLAFQLLQRASGNPGPFCRLVGDDRIQLQAANGRLVASVPGNLAGLLEVRGLGILRVPFESQAQIGLVVDLVEAPRFTETAVRLPESSDLMTTLLGVQLPYLRLTQDDPATLSTISTAMEHVGIFAGNAAENQWMGLAETDKLVLSKT